MNCSQLYIGADMAIAEMDSDGFPVRIVPSASSEANNIRGVLGSKYIYYLAPHLDCGCSWDFLDTGNPNDELSRRPCEAFGWFLTAMEQFHTHIKIYSVCTESLGASSRVETPISLGEFMRDIDRLRISYSSPGAKVYVLAPNNPTKTKPPRGSA